MTRNYQDIIHKLFEELDQDKWSRNEESAQNDEDSFNASMEENIRTVGIDAPKTSIKYSEILKQLFGYYYIAACGDDEDDPWIGEDGSYGRDGVVLPFFEYCGERIVKNYLNDDLGRGSRNKTPDYIEVEGSLVDLDELGKLNPEGRELLDLLCKFNNVIDEICRLGTKHGNLFTFFNLYDPNYLNSRK